ncbi:MAG TPA: hypothetical protein PKY63_10560 [Bacteroidales bacterium]|nr:hypothetical protein [Bacteroidales bacterium]
MRKIEKKWELYRPEGVSKTEDGKDVDKKQLFELQPDLNEVKFNNHLVGLIDENVVGDQNIETQKQLAAEKKIFSRNKWVKIKYRKKAIFRIVKGTVAAGFTEKHIWLSYDSRIALGIRDNKEGKSLKLLTVKKCNRFESLIWAPLHAADPILKAQYRLATFLAVLGVVISVIGLVISLNS